MFQLYLVLLTLASLLPVVHILRQPSSYTERPLHIADLYSVPDTTLDWIGLV